jgi:hypothetical protein
MADPIQPAAAQAPEAAASAAQAGSSEAAATAAPTTPDGVDEYSEFLNAVRAQGRTAQDLGAAVAIYDRFVGAPDQLEAFVKNIDPRHPAKAAMKAALRAEIVGELTGDARSARELRRMLAARDAGLAEERGAPSYDSSYEPASASGADEAPPWFKDFAAGLDSRFKAIEGKADGAIGRSAQTEQQLVLAAELSRVARGNPIAAGNYNEWSADVQKELATGQFQGPGSIERASRKVLSDWARKGAAAGLRPAPAAPALNGLAANGNGKEPTQAELDTLYKAAWEKGRRSGDFTELGRVFLERRGSGG